MATEKAQEMAAQAWCTEKTSMKEMDVDLAEAFAEIIDKYREALIWCGGSDDFAYGGKAQIGYDKIVRPLL